MAQKASPVNAKLGPQGAKLLEILRRIFGGNHVESDEIRPVAEQTDAYRVTANVAWRFEHEITTTTRSGNASIKGRHFGPDRSGFQAHIQRLCREAVNDQNIRGPFMQRILAAGAVGLYLPVDALVVHDFGSFSLCRNCSACHGSGKNSCGRCHGKGKIQCGLCLGRGWTEITVQKTQWDGRFNKTHYERVRQYCYHCSRSGQLRCTVCAGSGEVTCMACHGHGFFTDIARIRSLARSQWLIPDHSGFGASHLVQALRRDGPAHFAKLVPFDLASNGYDQDDHWVVHYAGTAKVVELGVEISGQSYSVLAAGSRPEILTRPPIFDHLLSVERRQIEQMNTLKRNSSGAKRQARELFSTFRNIRILNEALALIANVDKTARNDPGAAIARLMDGFISVSAAGHIGTAVTRILDTVSPPNSRVAWTPVALVTMVVSFIAAANSVHFVSSLSIAILASMLSLLIAAPVGWLSSTITSYLGRRRIPARFRQSGRNWAPLKWVAPLVALSCLAGGGYGMASGTHGLPVIPDETTPVLHYLISQAPPNTPTRRFLARISILANAATATRNTREARHGPSGGPMLIVTGLPWYVRAVQRHLIAYGYLHGQPDGVSGPETRAAIAHYEQHMRLSSQSSWQQLLAYMRQHGNRPPSSAQPTGFWGKSSDPKT